MINEIIQDIKEEAINSGKNLTMETQAYKKYLSEQVKIKLANLDPDIILNDFYLLSREINLNNLEPFDLEIREDMSVYKLINDFKLTLITSYIVKETAKSFLGFKDISVN